MTQSHRPDDLNKENESKKQVNPPSARSTYGNPFQRLHKLTEELLGAALGSKQELR
ncbi:hypothetical protein H2198_004990 [Neophaeococcomyces mojaviensis]|uniref:Uncharacterized protein n=1 Tax=Neophaeococcomyces mojaviensis TaxID=3383035 RepID=A0ACC3A7B7_9EURO|nr:hypothetical protein H2198_004990 [Knufia sp. JES_112]